MGTLSDFKTLYKTDSLIERYEAINIENVAGLNSLGKLPELKERLSSAMGLYGEIEGAINDLSPVLGQLESNATAMRAKITDAYDTQAEPVMVDGISAPDYEAMIDAAWEEHNTACDLIVELDTMKTNLNNWISTWSPTADQLEAAQRPSPPVIIVEEVTPPPTPPENTAFRLSKISIPDITIISIDASNRAGSLRVDASSKRSVFEYYAQPNFDKNIALMQLRTILGQIDDILANEEIDLLIDKLGTTGANLSKARQEIKAATEGANAVASAAAGNDMEAARVGYEKLLGCTISEADGIYALAESRYDTIKGYQKEIGEHLLELARIKDLISAKIAELESMPEPVEPAGGGGGEGGGDGGDAGGSPGPSYPPANSNNWIWSTHSAGSIREQIIVSRDNTTNIITNGETSTEFEFPSNASPKTAEGKFNFARADAKLEASDTILYTRFRFLEEDGIEALDSHKSAWFWTAALGTTKEAYKDHEIINSDYFCSKDIDGNGQLNCTGYESQIINTAYANGNFAAAVTHRNNDPNDYIDGWIGEAPKDISTSRMWFVNSKYCVFSFLLDYFYLDRIFAEFNGNEFTVKVAVDIWADNTDGWDNNVPDRTGYLKLVIRKVFDSSGSGEQGSGSDTEKLNPIYIVNLEFI